MWPWWDQLSTKRYHRVLIYHPGPLANSPDWEKIPLNLIRRWKWIPAVFDLVGCITRIPLVSIGIPWGFLMVSWLLRTDRKMHWEKKYKPWAELGHTQDQLCLDGLLSGGLIRYSKSKNGQSLEKGVTGFWLVNILYGGIQITKQDRSVNSRHENDGVA